MNILDLLKGQLGSGIAGQLGGILGEDEKKTESAIGAALPSILGGLMGQANSKEGADALHKQLQDHDGGIFDNLGSMLTGGGHTGLLNSGSGILNGLLGNKLGAVAGIVSKLSGLGGSSATSLLGMLAPLVMGFLGKTVKSKGMDAMGLQGLLKDQAQYVAPSMPAGMGDALGLSSSGLFDGLKGAVDGAAGAVGGAVDAVGGAAGSAAGAVGDAAGAVGGAAADGARAVGGAAADGARAVTGAAGDAAQAGGSLLKTLLPLIIIGALGFLGFQMMGGCGGAEDLKDKVTDTVGDAAKGVGDAAGAVGDAAKGAAGAVTGSLPSFEMPSFDGVEFPEGFDVDGMKDKFSGITTGLSGVTADNVDDFKAKVEGLTGSVDSMGLDKLTGPAKAATGGMIGGFIKTLTGALGGMEGGILGTLKPVITALIEKLTPFAPAG